MPQYFIAKSDTHSTSDQWRLIDLSTGTANETVGTLTELSEQVGGEPVMVLMSAAEVTCLHTRVAGRSEAQIKQAAPYAVEEELVDDVDVLTFKVFEQDKDGLRRILAYDESRITILCEQLKDKGFKLAGVIPDAALLSADADTLTILAGAGEIYLNFAGNFFTRMSPELLPVLLPRTLRAHPAEKVSLLIGADVEEADALAEEIEKAVAALPGKTVLTTETSKHSALYYLVRSEATGDYPQYDLLPAAMRDAGKLGFVQRWGFAAAAGIAVLALGLHIGLNLKSNTEKESELTKIKDQQQALFKQAFPEVRRIVNAEAQAKQLLQEMQQAGPPPAEFLNVFYRSTELLANAGSGVKLVGFSFADGVMILRMESDDMSRLEKYRGELSGFLAAEVVSAESTEDVVRGAIRVRPN